MTRAQAAVVPMLQASLLGGFVVTTADGAPVSQPLAKGTALFAYLLLNAPKLQSRDRLCDLLWSDYPRNQARTNLRQTLMRLRRALSAIDDPIVAGGDNIGLRTAAIAADAPRFAELARAEAPADWARALALYGGELMAGFSVDSPVFDEWLLIERQRFADLAATAARRLLAAHEAAGRVDDGIVVARQLLALDNLQEDVHRTLIRLLDRAGRKDAAIAQYHRLEDLLRDQLDAAPAAESQALLRAVLDETPAAPPAPARSVAAGVVDKAIGFLRTAAERAHRRGAHGEAATLSQQALDLALDGGAAPAVELDLRAALQREYFAMRRFEDSLAELARISRLAKAGGDEARRVRAQCDQAQVLRVLGRLDAGADLARSALAGARALDDPHLEALANLRLAALHFSSGEYHRALSLLIVNVEVLDAALTDVVDEAEPGNPAVRSRSWLAWTCAELGRFEDGALYGAQAVELADRLGEMYACIHSRIALGVLRLRQRDFAAAAEWLGEAAALAERSQLPIFEGYIRPALALSLAEAGRLDAARAQLQAFKPATERAILLATLADANRLVGRPEVARELARRAVDRAVAAAERGDAGWAHRALGLAALATGDVDESRCELAAALEIADALGMAPLAERCRDELAALA